MKQHIFSHFLLSFSSRFARVENEVLSHVVGTNNKRKGGFPHCRKIWRKKRMLRSTQFVSPARCSSSFLASLLSNSDKMKQQREFPSSLVNQQQQQHSAFSKPKMSVPLIFDSASLKLDVLPKGLSKKNPEPVRDDILSLFRHEKQSQQTSSSSFASSSTAPRASQSDTIRFPSFNDSSEYDAKMKRELQEQKRRSPKHYSSFVTNLSATTTEETFALLSVSRRVGDWEEAMRVAAHHWKPEFDISHPPSSSSSSSSSSPAQSSSASGTVSASTPTLQQQLGMAAQAAWACARAVEVALAEQHAAAASNSTKPPTTSNDDHADTIAGAIHALNLITMHLISRIENRRIQSDRDVVDAKSDEQQRGSPPSEQDDVRRRCSFIRSTAGNLVSISEAMRACGGIDLVMALDGCIGRTLRTHWKDRGLLLETQRWNHEMFKVYDLCDDWKGALGFFLHHCGTVVKPPPQVDASSETAGGGKEESVTFEFKKKKDDASAIPSSSSSDPSIIGASTLAVLIELLNRNEQQSIVSELLSSKSLVREAERAAIARAFSLLINQWSSSPGTMRRRRDGAASDDANSGLKLSPMMSTTDPSLSDSSSFFRAS